MIDVYGLGNALVDMEYHVDDSFLRDHDVAKGHMTLVDDDRLSALAHALSELTPEPLSGGSAANTVIAVRGFGASAFYSCKLADDETGNYFIGDLRAAGIDTNPNALNAVGEGPGSGRCLILITPDAERSMNTCLGISQTLGESEIHEPTLRQARYFYAEGYMCSSPPSKAAAIMARQIAEAAGVKTAFSLSDPAMVEFFRDDLAEMLGNGVDHLFCNEEEALSWAGTDRMDVAIDELKDVARALNITLGKDGCISVSNGRREEIPGYKVQASDTTGAGDMYAGACLYGWCAGMEPARAARFGNYAAAQLVQNEGARLRRLEHYGDLRDDFARRG